MQKNLQATAQHWSEFSSKHSEENTGEFWWEAGPLVKQHINEKISGNKNTNWVKYTVNKYFKGRSQYLNCLSLGCGGGTLERELAKLDAFKHCDAYDLAEGSIKIAREKAIATNYNNINYQIIDVNSIELPENIYNAVWIHSAMHHFENLEYISDQIKKSLKPEGLLVLNEYVGPNRFQFSERQKEITNLCLQLIPEKFRTFIKKPSHTEEPHSFLEKDMLWYYKRFLDKIHDGDLLTTIRRHYVSYKARKTSKTLIKTEVNFPSKRDVIAIDPSEAIRSEDIVKVIQKNYKILEMKGWGGNILQFLLTGIAGNFSKGDPESQSLLKMLINIEDTLIECGELESDFMYIVAQPIKNL